MKGSGRFRFPVISSLLVSLIAVQAAAGTPLRGVGFEEDLASEPLLSQALDQAKIRTSPETPVWACVSLRAEMIDIARLDARVDLYRKRGVALLLRIDDLPDSVDQASHWSEAVASLATHCKGRVDAYQIGTTATTGTSVRPAEYSYFLKLAAVGIRAADPDTRVLEGLYGDREWMTELYSGDVATYLDGVVLTNLRPEIRQIIAHAAPTATILAAGVDLGRDPVQAAGGLLRTQIDHRASNVPLTLYGGTLPCMITALATTTPVRELLMGDVVPLDENTARPRFLSAGGAEIPVPHFLFYDLSSFATYLVLSPQELLPAGDITVELAVVGTSPPRIRYPENAAAARSFSRDDSSGISRFVLSPADSVLVAEFVHEDRSTATSTNVFAQSLPTVDEIIFRHRQFQAVQDSLLQNYSADARMEMHFRPATADAGYDVVTENRFYHDREGSEFEELSFSVNGARWGSKHPPLPLLQPEKVLSLPLLLRFNEDYRYRLDGVETVGESLCYVVAFDPVSEKTSLYRGKVWIDGVNYARVKVQAVQTHLSVPVSSNEETQFYSPVAEASGRSLYLLTRLTNRQLFLMAGRNLPIERTITWTNFQVNAPGFQDGRSAARKSDHIMLRDTDAGIRYFVKRGEERVVSDRSTTSATALAFGLTIDPSFKFPLPMGGINYLDFDFLFPNTQLALLWGGVLALGNIQHPQLIGQHIDASLDFFAIAVPIGEQVYDPHGEIRGERLWAIPATIGGNIGYQFTDFQKLSGSYHVNYAHFRRDDSTDPAFVTPSNTLTHHFGVGYEYHRNGYGLTGGIEYAVRSNWRPWGWTASFDPSTRTFWRYATMVSKDFTFRTFHKLHADAAYFSGRRLDRFSEYRFGFFSDTRVHGVPSTIRLRDLAVLRGSYSFNIFDVYRLDLYLDQASGIGLETSAKRRSITGIGVGINMRAPWNTLLKIDVGKSFLPRIYSSTGSYAIQVMLLKPRG